ncbi:uncharacterized protein LOC133743045 isoform X2 [Rosa rugosa]|uniref:uncharacterized protein LOC133743045 isoform X2 n=1 Tax=Rosa rugosa TaxID=74645 RepID=UPI002B410DCC|nr:uncharacterized protein LOC133743045 isoform X2 [Rosa rugosa]
MCRDGKTKRGLWYFGIWDEVGIFFVKTAKTYLVWVFGSSFPGLQKGSEVNYESDQFANRATSSLMWSLYIRFLNEGSNLDSLNLKQCKAYLRTDDLRISGTQLVCLQRVEEHRRLRDGNGEALYPRPSLYIKGGICY